MSNRNVNVQKGKQGFQKRAPGPAPQTVAQNQPPRPPRTVTSAPPAASPTIAAAFQQLGATPDRPRHAVAAAPSGPPDGGDPNRNLDRASHTSDAAENRKGTFRNDVFYPDDIHDPVTGLTPADHVDQMAAYEAKEAAAKEKREKEQAALAEKQNRQMEEWADSTWM